MVLQIDAAKPSLSGTNDSPESPSTAETRGHGALGLQEAYLGCPQHKCYVVQAVNSKEFRRWLATQGCTFESKKSGSGHLIVRRGNRKSELPMHGGRKELGQGLVNKIKRDLGSK